MKKNGHAIDTGNDGLLHRNRETLIALVRDRDCLKLYLQPTVDALGRPVMLAVGKPREFDAPPHIDRIDRRSRKVVHPGVAPRDNCSSNERHSPADHVYGNHVETLALIRRELSEIRAQKVRKRT